MFGKKEKWEERKGIGEKWRENKKLRYLVGGENRENRKKKKYVGPTKNLSPQIGENS